MEIFSVSEITKYIKQLLDSNSRMISVFIRGEISNFKQHYSGHCYFTLKDNSSLIRAVMFKSRAQLLRFTPVNGLRVIAGGRITIYERDGQYQLYVDQLLPDGIGELSLAYEQLKDKLEKEGLFSSEQKKPLPPFPQVVGVITSPTGAALRDIITVAARRFEGVKLRLYPVLVQGDEAPQQIVKAIHTFNKYKLADVLIVGRGGGSIEELWAFNDERVVRAVAASNIPVVSAVGHQTDYTLIDFAADIRAATPSQAAEIVIPDKLELIKKVNILKERLDTGLVGINRRYRMRIEACLASRAFIHPEDMFNVKYQRVDYLTQQLTQVFDSYLLNKKHRFIMLSEKIGLLNPLAILKRGYSIVEDDKGKVIKRANEVENGQDIKVVLMEGIIKARVYNNKGEA